MAGLAFVGYAILNPIYILKFIASLPKPLQQWLVKLLRYPTLLLAKKTNKVVETNLNWCFAEQTPAARRQLHTRYVSHNLKLFMEVASVWTRQAQEVLAYVKSIRGGELVENPPFDAPIILVLPHMGNWELIWPWLCQIKEPLAMYSPSKNPAMDKVVFDARARYGGEPCATDKKGLLKLLKGLKQGKVLIILPDQVPQSGSGIYSSFFGHSAYTMTLLHKLASKSKATLLMASVIRKERMYDYEINIEPCGNCNWQQDLENFNQSLNQAIEGLIRRHPEQYQWSYKRFKKQPDGSRPYD